MFFIKKPSVFLAGIVGNILEWFDFSIYGFLAPVLASLFFKLEDPIVALLAAYGGFTTGFIMRPLGALIYGEIGDKRGRKTALIVSIIFMGISTFCMGVLPTYAKWGAFATILLIILRMVQGISVGGEFAGSAVFMAEYAPENRRGIYSSAALSSAFIGMLLASALGAFLSKSMTRNMFFDKGWRILFMSGIVIAILGLIARLHISDTPIFKHLKEKSHSPIKDAFKHSLFQIFQAIGITSGGSVCIYLLFIFMPTYFSIFLNVTFYKALLFNSINMIVLAASCVFSGYISDKIGRKKIMLISSIVIFISSLPLFILLQINSDLIKFFTQFIMALLSGAFLGPMMAILVELFYTKTRYTSLSIGYNIGFTIFGGITPLVGTFIIKLFNSTISPAFYLMFCMLISAITLISTKESAFEVLKKNITK